MGAQDNRDNSEMRDSAPPLSEWLVAALGLVLFAASAGYLGWHALRGGEELPAPAIRVLAVQPQGGHYVVRLRVTNRSPATAAALRVEATLRRGTEEVERSETQFQYLPGRSSVQGGLFFERDPRLYELKVVAKGFEEP